MTVGRSPAASGEAPLCQHRHSAPPWPGIPASRSCSISPTITYAGQTLAVRLILRLDDQRVWRGKLQFQAAGVDVPRETFEIFCGAREQDLWESVQSLREHHFRDLYRSLE